MIAQALLWGVLYALPLFVRSDFLLTIFIFTFIYGILAVTFDLIFGFTGQLSMFHPAVFGVSAYMTYLLASQYKLPFWVATVPSALTAVVLAVVVGSICFKFRLKTFYFAVVTLAFAEMIRLVVMNWNSLTNGTLGLVVSGKPTIYWPGSGVVAIRGPIAWYYLTLACLSVTVLICARCLRAWMGRCFGAIRLNEDLARTLGINVFRYKLLAFAISSFYAGVTGVLYTYYLGIANYEQFQIGVSIDYLAMIIIGGLGSVLGSVLGAIFVTLLPIGIRYAMEAFGGLFFAPQTVLNLIPNLRLMMFGALIIFFLIVEPEGLNRLWRNIRNYFRIWPFAY